MTNPRSEELICPRHGERFNDGSTCLACADEDMWMETHRTEDLFDAFPRPSSGDGFAPVSGTSEQTPADT